MIRLPLLALIVIALACVDPNNLTFSNQSAQGLESKRVELLSRYLQAKDILATTRPDYRSSHVFVTRAEQPMTSLTLDDRRLRSRTIGLQMAGIDAMNSAPAFATARRGLARNVQGNTHYGNYDWSNPLAGNVNALVTARSMSRWNGGL